MRKFLILLVALIGCSETETDSVETEAEVTIPEKQEYPNTDYVEDRGSSGCLAYKTIYYKGVPVPTKCEVMFIDTGRPPDKQIDLHIQEKVTEVSNEI
jgi:hypothetical protein